MTLFQLAPAMNPADRQHEQQPGVLLLQVSDDRLRRLQNRIDLLVPIDVGVDFPCEPDFAVAGEGLRGGGRPP